MADTTCLEASSRHCHDSGKEITMPAIPSAQRIAALSDRLSKVTSHAGFLGLLQKLQDTPPEKRKQFVRDNMNTKALAAAGVPTPEGLRSVVRVFEDPQAAVITSEATQIDAASADGSRSEDALSVGGTLCTSLGMIVCVSYGEAV
jgi:hypothetical protein